MNQFKLEQQLKTALAKLAVLEQRCADYKAKLQKPVFTTVPNMLRTDIAFWKSEAHAAQTRVDELKVTLEDVRKDLNKVTAERDAARAEVKAMNAQAACVAAITKPKRQRKPKAAVASAPDAGDA